MRPKLSINQINRPQGPASAAVPDVPDIAAYWSDLCDGRRFPAAGDLDAGRIATWWPNAVLLRAEAGNTTLRVAALFKPLVASPGPAQSGPGRGVDFAPKIVEWMLAVGEAARREARPRADRQAFVGPRGPARYDACALPFSDNQADIDHVLCYVRAAP